MKYILIITIILSGTLSANCQDADLSSRIGKAIDKGVAWLKKHQEKDGSWGRVDEKMPMYAAGTAYDYKVEFTALSLVALLKSDVPPSDPVVKKGFEFIGKYLGNGTATISSYGMGVILMAIEAKYAEEQIEKDKKAGVQPKGRAGDWKEPKYSISASDKKLADSLVKDLIASQSKRGGWRYGNRGVMADAGDEDISATQIALLGLKSATRMGITIDKNVFKKALDYILWGQEKDGPQVVAGGGDGGAEGNVETGGGGSKTEAFIPQKVDKARGWCYMPGNTDTKGERALFTNVSGGMTAAGITGLIVCKSVLASTLKKDELKKLDQAIYDGIAWICSNYTVGNNPGGLRSHYYYLYGLERVGILGNFEAYGDNYWYKDCAEVLCDKQEDDGHWNTNTELPPSSVVDSDLALIILRRGTVPMGPVLTPR